MLIAKDLNKSFSGFPALKDVSIEVRDGEVVGLVGENGAGKSTLMRVLAGVYVPDRGSLSLDGEPLRLRSPREANAAGIGIVFQEQSLLLNLSVAENIYLGQEREFTSAGVLNWPRLRSAARRQLKKVGVDVDPKVRTSELSFAARQMVELAKALALEERTQHRLVILLDEPTSVLEQREIDILFERVRSLRERASFVFVSHRLDEVLAVSDRVYIMRDGGVVAERLASATSVGELHQLMVGHELQAEYYRESAQVAARDEVVLSADNLSIPGAYKNVSFELHQGEILGIAGVIGSGREELTRTMFGFLPYAGGTLSVNGRPVRFRAPSEAVKHSIGYIPRERRVEGLVLPLSISANITLASLRSVFTGLGLNHGRERSLAREWVQRLRIRARSIESACLHLSGGNQQKVVLAKWLNARSKILILDHPTRGLDVGAKSEVYDLMRQLSAEGVAIVLTADTLEETIGLCHTILVMRDGEVTARFAAPPHGKPTQVELIRCMV